MLIDRHKFFLSQPIPKQSWLQSWTEQNGTASQPTPTPTPPPPNQGWSCAKAKTCYFLILDLGQGLGEEERYKSPISSVWDILTVRVARCMDFALHSGVVCSFWLSQLKEFLGFKNQFEASCSLWLVYRGGTKGRRSKPPVSRTLAAFPTPTLFY